MFFIHEAFLVYKMETFKNCQEVKHIIIMIIAIIYIFLSYMIFDQQLKITFRKFSTPLKKSLPPFYSLLPLKMQKVQVPPFCQPWKFFSPPLPPAERGEDTMLIDKSLEFYDLKNNKRYIFFINFDIKL